MGDTQEPSTTEFAETNAVLATVLRNLPVGVLVEDSGREIIAVNPTLCEVLEMDRQPAELVGRNCARVADELREAFADPDRFRTGIETKLDRREPVFDEEFRLANGQIVERSYIPCTLPDRQANIWLYRDVTDRNEREREPRAERLEEFLSVVSHDLRNPLNVATANLEAAADASADDRLDAALDALERMNLLIEDLLVLTREENAIGDTEPVHLGELIRDCWSHVETAAATLDVDADRTVRADRSRLAQVFENLFRNAVEHGGEDVTIAVGTVSDGIYVEDDGPGVPSDERDRIFDATYSTSENGTGLGLRIVETIVDAHGWEIELAETDRDGTRFEITGVQFFD